MNRKTSFWRVRGQWPTLLFAVPGIVMLYMGAYAMSGGFTGWKIRFWEDELPIALFLGAFLAVWYGIILRTVWYSLQPLQRVVITDEVIRIQFGPICLKKLPLMEVKTVISTGRKIDNWRNLIGYGRRRQEPWGRLILTTVSSEDLETLRFWQKGFWVNWSSISEEILRENLPHAVFLLR